MEWWMFTAAANVVMVTIYAGIAVMIIRGLTEGGQWRSNPIGLATAAVFVSCTIGHGLHLIHVIPPWSVLDPVEAAAGRAMFADWRLITWDVFTAGTAIAFWLLRSRLGVVYNGAALCEDLQERERQAAQLHDRVMTGLQKARADLDAGRREAGLRALDDTLEESKTIITTLLGSRRGGTSLGPGDLRRDAASP